MIFHYPRAIVRSVYDGDTVRVDLDLGFGTWRMNEPLRLQGINAPELTGDQRATGIMARDALRERILGETVTVTTYRDSREKYGRYLATIKDADGDVNQWLIASGYATAYDA